VTVHFYSHLGVGDASVDQILDENKLRGAAQRFKQLKVGVHFCGMIGAL
jgi:hypothetical protein